MEVGSSGVKDPAVMLSRQPGWVEGLMVTSYPRPSGKDGILREKLIPCGSAQCCSCMCVRGLGSSDFVISRWYLSLPGPIWQSLRGVGGRGALGAEPPAGWLCPGSFRPAEAGSWAVWDSSRRHMLARTSPIVPVGGGSGGRNGQSAVGAGTSGGPVRKASLAATGGAANGRALLRKGRCRRQ